MPDVWQEEISDTRTVAMTHPEGHKFLFEFPEGWNGGHLPRSRPAAWADDERADRPWIEAEAAILATAAAKAQGWIPG